MEHFPDLQSTCDRRLADVEGMHGSALFLKNRLDDAVPLLKAVADRPDSGVRRETLTMALEAYVKTLMIQGKGTEAEPVLQRLRQINAER